MSKIKTCLIGCGRNANKMHKPPLIKHPAFEVVGVYDINREAAENTAKDFGCKVFDSYEETIKSKEFSFGVVITYNSNHQPISLDLARAGKDVLVTKPWAVDIKQADEIIGTMKETGRVVMPYFPMRWHPQTDLINDIINSGKLGKVFHVTRYQSTFGQRTDWQMYKEYAGGYLNNWGPHLVQQILDIVCTLDDSIGQVYADTKLVLNPGDTEDVILAAMKTKNGVLVNIEYNINTDFLPNWVIRGDKGTLYITDDLMSPSGDITLHEVAQPEVLDPLAYRNPFTVTESKLEYPYIYDSVENSYKIYDHISKVLKGETKYSVPVEFSYNVTKIMDAIRTSAETNSIVKF